MLRFEERVNDANTLVIGASYGLSDYQRWSTIDPNYIGIGHSYGEQEQILLDHNPLGGLWGTPEFHTNFLDFAFGKGNSHFDYIFIDRGTLHHLLREFREIFQYLWILVRNSGEIIIPCFPPIPLARLDPSGRFVIPPRGDICPDVDEVNTIFQEVQYDQNVTMEFEEYAVMPVYRDVDWPNRLRIYTIYK